MFRIHRLPTAGFCACLLALSVVAGGAQVFRQRVDVVTIDVSVVDGRGNPLPGLSATDFEVTADGKPRKIIAFRAPAHAGRLGTEAASPGVSAGAVANAPERLVVIAVQRDQIPPRDGKRFLEAGAAFVDSLPPSDAVAVWTIPATHPQLRTENDRTALKASIVALTGRAGGPAGLVTVTPDEAVSIVSHRDAEVREAAIARECGRLTIPIPSCPQQLDQEAARKYNEVSTVAANTLRGFEQLFALMAPFAGPKHVVFLSTGPAQTPENQELTRRVARAAAAERIHVHALQVPYQQELGRADVASSPPQVPKQYLSMGYSLAEMTGGILLTPSDPRVAFTRLSNQLAGTYELGIEAEPGDRDGKPHRLAVRIPARPDTSIRARQEFVLAPAVAATTAAPAPQPAAAPPEAVTPVTPPVPPRSDTGTGTASAMSTALAEYVEHFEREFSSAVAEERYVQLVRPLRGTPSWPSDERALEWTEDWAKYPRTAPVFNRRQLLSDVLLVHTKQGWLGYRDVAIVDGRSLRNRTERISRLFLSKDADRADQLRRVAQESARYNIGRFRRTLNFPTLPLSFLHRKNHKRFTFVIAASERLGDRDVHVLRYEEHARPTLIGSSAGEDVPIAGRVWLDAVTGAVVQTEMRVIGDRRGQLLTRYRQEPGFGVLVPDFMWEWYDGEVVAAGSVYSPGIVECLARYGKYRRFAVTTEEKVR